MGQNAHAKGLGPNRHADADLSEAKNPESLAEELKAVVLLTLPSSILGGTVCARDLPGQRQEEGKNMLGNGNGILLRAEGNDDPGLGGGGNIDVVIPGPGPAN